MTTRPQNPQLHGMSTFFEGVSTVYQSESMDTLYHYNSCRNDTTGTCISKISHDRINIIAGLYDRSDHCGKLLVSKRQHHINEAYHKGHGDQNGVSDYIR